MDVSRCNARCSYMTWGRVKLVLITVAVIIIMMPLPASPHAIIVSAQVFCRHCLCVWAQLFSQRMLSPCLATASCLVQPRHECVTFGDGLVFSCFLLPAGNHSKPHWMWKCGRANLEQKQPHFGGLGPKSDGPWNSLQGLARPAAQWNPERTGSTKSQGVWSKKYLHAAQGTF